MLATVLWHRDQAAAGYIETEYDSAPTDAPDDAFEREGPWVESALVDEHEPGYTIVAATSVVEPSRA